MAVRITLANSHDDFAHVEPSEGTVDATHRSGRSWRSRFGFTAVWLAGVELPGRHFEPSRVQPIRSPAG
jgi:hypothetical protein